MVMAKQKPINKNSEELFLKLFQGLGEFGIRFDSAFSKILPIIIVGLIIFGLLANQLIKFFLIGGVIFSFLLLMMFWKLLNKILILFKEMSWLFVKAELVRPLYRMTLLGQMNKELGPIEKSKIVKVQTISARVRIVNPKVSTEVKKLNQVNL